MQAFTEKDLKDELLVALLFEKLMLLMKIPVDKQRKFFINKVIDNARHLKCIGSVADKHLHEQRVRAVKCIKCDSFTTCPIAGENNMFNNAR